MARTQLLSWRRDRAPAGLGRAHPSLVLRGDMDQLFDQLWQGFDFAPAFGWVAEDPSAWTPRITLSETEAAIRVDAELPGLTEKDFEVVLEGELLTLQGEKRSVQQSKGVEFRRVERRNGRFERTIALPCEVEAEKVSATYRHGLLSVTLPKMDAAKRGAREIEVRTS